MEKNLNCCPDRFSQDDIEGGEEIVSLAVPLPLEIRKMTAMIFSEVKKTTISSSQLSKLNFSIDMFCQGWEKAYTRFGNKPDGELAYRDIVQRFYEAMTPQVRRNFFHSESPSGILKELRQILSPHPPAQIRISRELLTSRQRKTEVKRLRSNIYVPEFHKPIFILSAPRAGSTLLFETLLRFPDVWSTGEENHEVIERLPGLHPSAQNYASNRLSETEATPDTVSALRESFTLQMQDRDGSFYVDLSPSHRPDRIRFIEKTPKNALRAPFLKAAFPDARFIFLYRDPRENISSLMEGWRSRRFVAYRNIPGWPYREWSFLLVPGWRLLKESPLSEIAAYQWKMANSCILEDLQGMSADSWHTVCYTDLIRDPEKKIKEISKFAEFHWDTQVEQSFSNPLPISRMTLSPPSPNKWQRYKKEINAVLPSVEPLECMLKKL
ncbi:MAG: sulfotransferase [Candidatus Electrothrix sp. AS4_5]|nr:sulfotransferase [Candidatus Electrothrix gigas]